MHLRTKDFSRPAALAALAFALLASAAHAFEVTDTAGKRHRLADYKGQWVVVNFWATWCAPCVAEMPSLSRLRERMGPQRLEVVGVNFQENAARIEPFVRRLGVAFPIVRDHDGSLRKAWQVNVFPTTFVVGPAGDVRWVVVGEIDWDEPAVESRLRSVR